MKYAAVAALGLCSLASATFLPERDNRSWHPGAEECTPETTRTEGWGIDDRTVMFRQNPCVDYEANLVYLLVGTQRALLIDTGAVEGAAAAPLVEQVQRIVNASGEGKLPLLVVHTHGHQDHRAGDPAFAALPNTVVAPYEGASLRKHFGFQDWPNGVAQIDLGDRIVDVIPTPGHHEDHIVFYDRKTELLFTGDFLLPGRLLVQDIDAYRASASRVAEFVKTHAVDQLFGAHIELDADGNLYPSGASFHPNERLKMLTAQDALALPWALQEFNGFYSRYPDFVVVNPIHNLLALAAGIIAALTLLVWVARRLWKRRSSTQGRVK